MAQPFTAAPHHDVLGLLVQVSVLLFTARALGAVAKRMGQPTVVGEILAGVILGPSLLSRFFPWVREWILPHTAIQGHLLEMVSLIGAMFLLLITGMETDFSLMRRQARSVVGAALGGLVLPLALGFILGQLIPESLLMASGSRLVFAMFIAIALAISAIPVIAKVLMDLNLNRRNIGQTIIAAAMIDDTVGWILLSIVIGLVNGGVMTPVSIVQSIVAVLAFIGLSLTVGRWWVSHLFNFVQHAVQMPDKALSLAVLLMFIWGAIGHALGIEALLGALVIGMVLSRLPQLKALVQHKLESVALGIFAPIFFAVAGLKVHLSSLLSVPETFLVTLLVIGIAMVGKMAGVYAGARLIGRADHWTAVFYGAGLNARGSIGVIIANIGLSLNILSQDMFSVIVVMAIFTSVVSPVLMRWAVRHIQLDPEEVQRLRREELLKDSLLANVHRVLLPVRASGGGLSQPLEMRLLQQLNQTSGIALTLFTVTDEAHYQASVELLDQLAEQFPVNTLSKKVVLGDDIGALILQEASMDYDLMILGTPEACDHPEALFTPLLDSLLHLSPCPTMLIQNQWLLKDGSPRHILMPSNGSQAACRAGEAAFILAANSNAEVTVLQVVEANRSEDSLDAEGALITRQRNIAQGSVEKLCEVGNLFGVAATPEVRIAVEPEWAILQTILAQNIDLLVLGTSIGNGSERLYLGPRVERILSNAPCPVIILNT